MFIPRCFCCGGGGPADSCSYCADLCTLPPAITMRLDLGASAGVTGASLPSGTAAALKSYIESLLFCRRMTKHDVFCHDPDYEYIYEDGYTIGYADNWGESGEGGGIQLGCSGGSSFYNAYLLIGDNLSYTYEGEMTVSGVHFYYAFGANLQRSGRSFFLDHAVCPLTAEIPIVGTVRMPDGFYDIDGIVLPFSVYVTSGANGANESFVSFPDARLMMAPSSCASPVFYNHNTWWYYLIGTGPEGTASAKYTADCEILGYLAYRPKITAGKAGVVHITATNVYYDYWWRVFRGSTKVIEYGSDSTPDSGGNTGSITNTFAVSAGDVITLGDPGDYNVCTNLQIWLTPT